MIFRICSSPVLNFWIFLTSRNRHFRLLLASFLTSHDMQDDAADKLRFLLKYYKMVKIWPKNSLVHFVRFFVYALLHLMCYVPRFWQMKDLIKIYVWGKFHQYSFCGCEVKKFFVLIQHSWNGPFLGFWESLLPKFCSILLKFWQKVVSNKATQCSKNPSKFWLLA